MGTALKIENEIWDEFAPKVSAELIICEKSGVFRRHHVGNNPLIYIDPNGLITLWQGIGGGVLILGGIGAIYGGTLTSGVGGAVLFLVGVGAIVDGVIILSGGVDNTIANLTAPLPGQWAGCGGAR